MRSTGLVRRALVVSLQVGVIHLTAQSTALAAPGDLDTTFGGDGRVTTRFADPAFVSGVAVQDDGNIVVAGGTVPDFGTQKFALARYTPDGALDPAFGGDGRVTTAFTHQAGASAVALQEDGSIVAAGSMCCPSGRRVFALARYTPDGALDPTFGGDGRVRTAFAGDSFADAVAIQDDGSIVAAGSMFPSFGIQELALTRYTPDGALDPTFGGDGRVRTAFAGDSFADAVAIQDDGSIVAAGGLFPDVGEQRFALARFTPDGALDPTFGGDGRVTTAFNGDSFAAGVAIQEDGNIVAAGSLFPQGRQRFALVRYTTDGGLDPTFSQNGKVTTQFGGNANGFAVALQDDGSIVVAGEMFSGGKLRFALARYTPDGALDPTFGGDGRVTTAFAEDAHAAGVAIQSDGKIVTAGTVSQVFPQGKFAVARYLG
jgi:uncharacterized delta-60 repeat protein